MFTLIPQRDKRFSFLETLPELLRLNSRLVAASLGIISGILTVIPAQSAEQITISYGPAESYVSINEIERFAKKGEVTPVLALYGTLLKLKDGQRLRKILQTPLAASPWSVEQLLNTPTGNVILTRVGKVLKTDKNENGYSALRIAVSQASNRPEGLTILGLLREFPGESIRVDLEFSLELLEDLLQILVEDELVIQSVEDQAQQAKINDNYPVNLSDIRKPGSMRWTEEELTFRNPNRDRPSPLRVYLPQVKKPVPLIVISHGLGSDPQTFSYIAQHLASHGFAVAIPEHLDTSADKFARFFDGFERPPNPSEFANRPLDITYLLDELQQKYQSYPFWKSRIDFNNVGVMGQSFGGYTALAVAGAKLNPDKLTEDCQKSQDRRITLNLSTLLQCRSLEVASQQNNFQDQRIKAVIAINPLTSLIFGEEGMSNIQVPTMIIAGTKDYVTPAVPEQIKPFTWLKTSRKHLILIAPGTHFSFLKESGGRLAVPSQLIGPDPNLAYPYLKAFSLAFFESYLQNQPEYLPYLSQTYVNTIEAQPFNLSLIEGLSQEQVRQAAKR